MKDQKGAVLILIVVVLMVTSTLVLYSYSSFLFKSQRDFLFSKYYERAIAAVLSCRETAMARLNFNFLYRIENENGNPNCTYSVINNHTSKDVYVDINTTSTIDVPKFIYPKNIIISINSLVKISHVGANIIKTNLQ